MPKSWLLFSSVVACLAGFAYHYHASQQTQPATSSEVSETSPRKNQTSFAVRSPIRTQRPPQPTAAQKEGLSSAFGKFQTGNYEEAVKILRLEHAQQPHSEMTTRNLATSLFALGLIRFKEQKKGDAESLLEEAAQLGHSEASRFLAGIKLKNGDIAAATQLLDEIFDSSKDPLALQTMVDLSLSRDDLEKAEQFLNRMDSLADESNDENIKAFAQERRSRLAIKRSFARSEQTVEHGRVTVAFVRTEMRALAEAVANTMENTIDIYSTRIANPPENARFRAIVLPTENFQTSTGAPAWAQALFDGIIRIPTPLHKPSSLDVSRAVKMARHETVHAFLYTLCGDSVPSWLGEGLAMKMEGRNPSQSFLALKAKGTLGDLANATAFDGPFAESSPNDVGEYYARAHLLVETIQEDRGVEVWRSLFGKGCLEKDSSLSMALDEIFGVVSGSELWKKYQATIIKKQR